MEASQPDAEKLAAEKREQQRLDEEKERARLEAEKVRLEEERVAEEIRREEREAEQRRAAALEEDRKRIQRMEVEAEEARQKDEKDKEERARREIEQAKEHQRRLDLEEAERARVESERQEAERKAQKAAAQEAARKAEEEQRNEVPAISNKNPYASQVASSQPEPETSVSKKRESYNPFLMAKAPQEKLAHPPKAAKDASDSDSDWDVVDENSSDDETEFPAAGSAKNLASLLFSAMGQKQTLPASSTPKSNNSAPSPLIPQGALSSQFAASLATPSSSSITASTPAVESTMGSSIPPPPPPPPMPGAAPVAEGAVPPPPPPPPPPPASGPAPIPTAPPPPGPTAVGIPVAPPPPGPAVAIPVAPPPPAPAAVPTPPSSSGASAGPPLPTPDAGRSALLSQIQLGAKLKKAKTNDRSQAAIAGRVQREELPPAPAQTHTESPIAASPMAGGGDGFFAELQARTSKVASNGSAQPTQSELVDSSSNSSSAMSPTKLKALRRESTEWFGQMASQQLRPDPLTAFESVTESHAEHDTNPKSEESNKANDGDERIDDYDLTKGQLWLLLIVLIMLNNLTDDMFETEIRCSAIWAYNAQSDTDLSFAQDDIIFSYPLKSGEQPDWGYGQSELTGLKGFFPANYIEPVKENAGKYDALLQAIDYFFFSS